MKKFIHVIVLVVVLVVGAFVSLVGYGIYSRSDNKFFSKELEYTQVSQEFENTFNTIDLTLTGDHKLVLQQGEKFSVTYSESKFNDFSVEEKNGVLKLTESSDYIEWKKFLFYKKKQTDVIVTVPQDSQIALKGNLMGVVSAELPDWQYTDIDLNICGSAKITAPHINASKLAFNVTGVADIKLNCDTQTVTLQGIGSMATELSGKCDKFKVDVSGTAALNVRGLECNSAFIEIYGTSACNMTGNAEELTVNTSGTCNLSAKDFSVGRVTLYSSGTTMAKVSVTDELNLSGGGTLNVDYWGEPRITDRVSGTKKIRKMN